jgi:glycosyltransferase involved in cell wall biosynthesis
MCARVSIIRTKYPHWGQYSGYNQFIRHIDQDEYQIDVRAVQLGNNDFPIANKWVQGPLLHLVQSNGVPVYELNDLVAEMAMLRKWWREPMDILHYLDPEHSLQFLPGLFQRLSRLKPRPRTVATFHQPPRLLDFFTNLNITSLLDRVIVVSPEQIPYFEEHLPLDRVSLILLGIDVDYFQPDSAAKEKGKFRCITVGSWLRDYDAVFAVAERLLSHADIEFQIVSTPVPPVSDHANTYVFGGIEDDALLRMYQRSDVLFLPLSAATANCALLEGIACGLPVVSSDLPSVRTYVPGKEAILVPRNDPDLLTEAVLRLYNHPEVRAEMAVCARQRAVELSWHNIALQHEAIYSELAG